MTNITVEEVMLNILKKNNFITFAEYEKALKLLKEKNNSNK